MTFVKQRYLIPNRSKQYHIGVTLTCQLSKNGNTIITVWRTHTDEITLRVNRTLHQILLRTKFYLPSKRCGMAFAWISVMWVNSISTIPFRVCSQILPSNDLNDVSVVMVCSKPTLVPGTVMKKKICTCYFGSFPHTKQVRIGIYCDFLHSVSFWFFISWSLISESSLSWLLISLLLRFSSFSPCTSRTPSFGVVIQSVIPPSGFFFFLGTS